LKILTGTQDNSSRLLEDISVFSPTQCSGERGVLGLELDKEHHALFVAFSSCIIRVPLSRCAQHGTCKRRCLHTHDPYCIWLRTGRCADVAPGFKTGRVLSRTLTVTNHIHLTCAPINVSLVLGSIRESFGPDV
ncbi:hypothetical protein cypCar_00049791, partial [Cyprinus carpio]